MNDNIDKEYKQGDTVPLEVELPVDLSNASSVRFKLGEGAGEIDDTATITDAPNGVVVYEWDVDETDRTGREPVEWEVTWNTGTIETFPKDGYDSLYFYDELS